MKAFSQLSVSADMASWPGHDRPGLSDFGPRDNMAELNTLDRFLTTLHACVPLNQMHGLSTESAKVLCRFARAPRSLLFEQPNAHSMADVGSLPSNICAPLGAGLLGLLWLLVLSTSLLCLCTARHRFARAFNRGDSCPLISRASGMALDSRNY